MSNTIDFKGKTVDDAITAATVSLGITSDQLQYEIIEKGSAGFLGIGSHDAIIRVYQSTKGSDEETDSFSEAEREPVRASQSHKKEYNKDSKREGSDSSSDADDIDNKDNQTDLKEDVSERAEIKRPVREKIQGNAETGAKATEVAKTFLSDIFDKMDISVNIKAFYEEDDSTLSIELSGDDMGIIIGKRGATLDSIQYLTNLAVNRKVDIYTRVKVDTEDYRRRRKETLENLAKNTAFKAKRIHRPVALESMNPYERRIIHYALQHDNSVTTHSEGEEPYRHVVVVPKR